MKKLMLAALLCACTVFGADLTGRWTGTVQAKSPDGEDHTEDVVLMLKQDGSTITGTAGSVNEGDQMPLIKPVFEGDTLKFDVSNDSGAIFHVVLKVSGDTMTGTANGEANGETRTATLKFERQK